MVPPKNNSERKFGIILFNKVNNYLIIKRYYKGITKEEHMKVVGAISLVLVIIGGLNWGLVGFFDFNLVDALFGADSVASRVVYGVVGVAALWTLIDWLMRVSKDEA